VRLLVSAGLVLLAAQGALAAPPSPAMAPIVKDGVEIAILPHVGSAGGSEAVSQIGLDIEARSADAVGRLGFRSLRAVTDIDCRQSANKFISATSFDQADFAGQGKIRPVSGEWVQPTADSYMAAVIQRVCSLGEQATASPRPPPVVTAAADPPPASPLATAPATATSTAAPPAPPAASPAKVRLARAAPPPTASAPPNRSAPALAAPAPALGPAKAGNWVAQVAASADSKDAQRVLDRVRGQVASPLTTTVELATVGAAQVYRASVVGFASAADAKAFCARIASVSKTCWAHVKTPAAAKGR
jgi:hypothetical protein